VDRFLINKERRGRAFLVAMGDIPVAPRASLWLPRYALHGPSCLAMQAVRTSLVFLRWLQAYSTGL
jgi:hypothetical protein